MEINRVSALDASASRLDAEYYKLAFRQTAAAVRRFGTPTTLEALRSSSHPIRRGIDMPRFSDDPTAPRMVTIASFADPGIDFTALDGIDPSQHAAFRASQLDAGDLVVAMGGYVGRAAICPPNPPLANIGRHSARVVVDRAKGDPYFVWSFLTSRLGELQLHRQVTGSVQAGVNLEDLRIVELPNPKALVQRYIGDKVRHAERLREQAGALETQVAGVHARHIRPATGIDFGKQTRRLPSHDLTERLDAHFYPAAVEQYLSQVGGKVLPLERLTSLLTNGQTQPEAPTGVLQATVTNLGRSFVEGVLRTVERPSGDSRVLAQHDLLMCNAAHSKSYIGRDITYCQVDVSVYPSTEVMVIRVDREQAPASFVRQYLKSDVGYLQIQSTIRGITAHSYPGDVKLIKVPVPRVAADERAAWFATDLQMLRAGQRVDTAKLLTTAATRFVELLVEGKLSEAEFAEAQKGLEAGDRTADRALLQALRRSGGADDAALFSDLDAVYGLLAEAEGEG